MCSLEPVGESGNALDKRKIDCENDLSRERLEAVDPVRAFFEKFSLIIRTFPAGGRMLHAVVSVHGKFLAAFSAVPSAVSLRFHYIVLLYVLHFFLPDNSLHTLPVHKAFLTAFCLMPYTDSILIVTVIVRSRNIRLKQPAV